jgi:hypothetical protein
METYHNAGDRLTNHRLLDADGHPPHELVAASVA